MIEEYNQTKTRFGGFFCETFLFFPYMIKNLLMEYSISTRRGDEMGFFIGHNIEEMKKMIEFLGHEIKEIKTNGTPDQTGSNVWMQSTEGLGRRANY